MNLPYMKTREEEEKEKYKVRRKWERITGLKIGKKVEFETMEIMATDRLTKSEPGSNQKKKRVRTGKLLKFYPHVALFDFGTIKRCIPCEMLEIMAQKGEFKIDW